VGSAAAFCSWWPCLLMMLAAWAAFEVLQIMQKMGWAGRAHFFLPNTNQLTYSSFHTESYFGQREGEQKAF